MARPTTTLRDRFLAKCPTDLPPDVCWPYVGAKDKYGYGQIMKSSPPTRWARAHRVAYEVFIGPIPTGPDGRPLRVRHTCDNPPCVNPAHLLIGTQGDNMADMVERGRSRGGSMPGETHPQSKMSDADRERVRTLYASGAANQRELGLMFEVHQVTIHRIVAGKTKT